uniref:Exonuclease domain-containing protein n=1 Tax=Arundo donax TaxID=35708 RepID=A0A0A9DQF6_ARUDO
MSLVLRFNLLGNNVWTSGPVRFLKQHAGFSSGKLLDPRSCEKRHFTTRVQTLETKFTETASWHKTDSGSCIPGIQSLWLQKTSEHDQPGTVLVFDIETTGFLHKDHRIIEFALRDLSGGKNCTFETLINPERNVPQVVAAVTSIGTDLVCRPDIPRFSDVLPTLLAYVRSRQAPGKPVLWVAHNAKNFDVPFLAQEFARCSAEIPADWFFVDSLSLARKLVKSEVKLAGEKRRLVNLEALRERYGICSEDTAHRAMRDVTILSQVIQKITFDLKLTYEGLKNESVRASDCRKLS